MFRCFGSSRRYPVAFASFCYYLLLDTCASLHLSLRLLRANTRANPGKIADKPGASSFAISTTNASSSFPPPPLSFQRLHAHDSLSGMLCFFFSSSNSFSRRARSALACFAG